jgi:dTDP-4-dehydrorhamnose 3,5-epimerase
MVVTRSKTLGLCVFTPDVFTDHRGRFIETFNLDQFGVQGESVTFVRDAISTSSRHVLRGIHYDDCTWKLIQCLHGEIFFVVIDLRERSDTYLRWDSFTLSDENRLQVLVPPHHGNGHLVLSPSCIFHYKLSEYYNPERERIFKWDDPRAGINWPVNDPILSHKDALGYDPNRRDSHRNGG